MAERPIYFSKGQLSVLWASIFAFLLVTGISAFAAGTNLQVEAPTSGPVQGCFTGWGSSYCTPSGGISEEECYNHMLEGQTQFVRRTGVCSKSPCLYREEKRGPAFCAPLDQSMKLTAEKSDVAGMFTVTWSVGEFQSGYEPQCTLSGKDPEKGGFSNQTNSGSQTFSNAPRGIYPFKFTCNGILNNATSLAKGNVSKTVNVFVGDIPPAPTVTLQASPDSITIGDSATLTWSSTNAIAVSISPGVGVVAKSGSVKVKPTFTTRYIITAAGEFPELGLGGSSATVRVAAGSMTPVQAPPPVEVPQEKPTVVAPQVTPQVGLLVNGQKGGTTVGVPATITLSWSANQYCIAYGSWLGIKTKADRQSITLTTAGTYTYNMYCPGLGSDSVKVIAGGAGAVVVLPVAEASISSDNKTFSRSIRVTRGAPVHLWMSAGHDVTGDRRASRDADGGWSANMSNGGACDWNYDLNQGTPTFDVRIPNPATAMGCDVDLGSVTFNDPPGVYTYGVLRLVQTDGKVSRTSSINIAVEPPPPPDTAPVVDLQVNGAKDKVILGAPARYAVTWSVHNADRCVASDDWTGDRVMSGSQNFAASSKRDLTYTLTCYGQLGTTTQSILVKVAELPVCDFSVLPTTLNKQSVFEQQSVLTWKCQFANTCSIDPSTGVSTGTFGTVRVSPKETTTYTLTCQNLDGTNSFEKTVTVQ